MMKPLGGGVYSYGSRNDADEELEAARRIVVPKRGARAALMRSQQFRRRRFLVGGSFSLLLVLGAAVCTFGKWDDAQFGALGDLISGTDAATTAMATSTGAANAQADDSDTAPALVSSLTSLPAEFLARSALSNCNSTDVEEFDRDGDGALSWEEIASGIDAKRSELLADIHASGLSGTVKASVASAVTENLANEAACVQAALSQNETSPEHSFEVVYRTFVDVCDRQPPSIDEAQHQGVVAGSESKSDASAVGSATAGRAPRQAHTFDNEPDALPAFSGHPDSTTLADPSSEPEQVVDSPITSPNELLTTSTQGVSGSMGYLHATNV